MGMIRSCCVSGCGFGFGGRDRFRGKLTTLPLTRVVLPMLLPRQADRSKSAITPNFVSPMMWNDLPPMRYRRPPVGPTMFDGVLMSIDGGQEARRAWGTMNKRAVDVELDC